MKELDNLNAAAAQLNTSLGIITTAVDATVAFVQASPTPAAIQSVTDTVNAVNAGLAANAQRLTAAVTPATAP